MEKSFSRLDRASVIVSISGRVTRISLHVQPSASKNEVLGFTGSVLRVKVAAPPVRDKANKELVTFLSQILGVNKGALTIIHGRASRNKVLTIDGLSEEQIVKRLLPG